VQGILEQLPQAGDQGPEHERRESDCRHSLHEIPKVTLFGAAVKTRRRCRDRPDTRPKHKKGGRFEKRPNCRP
jgi:hypothetical protein